MKLTHWTVCAICYGIVWSISVAGEVVTLKDGTKLEGSLTRTSDGYELKDATGKVTPINSDDVQSITIGPKVAGAGEAQSRLQSLRRSADNLSDLNAIIAEYHR